MIYKLYTGTLRKHLFSLRTILSFCCCKIWVFFINTLLVGPSVCFIKKKYVKTAEPIWPNRLLQYTEPKGRFMGGRS